MPNDAIEPLFKDPVERDDIPRWKAAWLVLRHGQQLPVVEVEYTVTNATHGRILTIIHYPGRVHGIIEGEEVWSSNGRFTIEQSIDVRKESTDDE